MDEIDPFEGLRKFPANPTGSAGESGLEGTTLEQAGLDRDAFLRIFLEQLENQDPFDPEDASELGSQLAVFSQLEQQIGMAEELRGIRQRLDDLIEVFQSPSGGSTLEPVALLGKTVEVRGDQLTAADSAELVMELSDPDADSLLIAGGPSLGAAALRAERGGTLPPGEYVLRFDGTQFVVTRPDGGSTALQFSPYREEAGRLLLLGPSVETPPVVPPVVGQTYSFRALSQRGTEGGVSELNPVMRGRVQSVRFADGEPRIAIAGAEIDPTKILRIR